MASTNVIESAFSIVETVCRNVKRWRAGDHIERWVGSGLLVAERQFRKVQGYREIPALVTSLATAVEEGCCRGSEGCVAYDSRESLTFNGVPGNVDAWADAATELEPEWGSPNDKRKQRLVGTYKAIKPSRQPKLL